MRKYARPAIGIGVAALVATAAALVGAHAAPAPSPATEQAAVLAPVAIDGVPVSGDSATDPSTLSEVTGVAEIAPPGSAEPGSLPAPVEAAIAALDAAGGTDEPAAEEIVAEAGAGDDPGVGPADPCSPADGDAPEGCPDGLHSAIFASTMPPDLRVWPWPDAPTSSDHATIYCPDLTPGTGELPLGVGTSVPASVTVRYWPVADPTDMHTLIPEGGRRPRRTRGTPIARRSAHTPTTGASSNTADC